MREKGQFNIWRKIKNNNWFSLIYRLQVLKKRMYLFYALLHILGHNSYNY